jgi:hypothetical protein
MSSNKIWYLLELTASGLREKVYVKLSIEGNSLFAWETYTQRMPDSYWVRGYDMAEPQIIKVQDKSIYFELADRFGKVKYLAIWIRDGIIMTEPVGKKPESTRTDKPQPIDGFTLEGIVLKESE